MSFSGCEIKRKMMFVQENKRINAKRQIKSKRYIVQSYTGLIQYAYQLLQKIYKIERFTFYFYIL